MAMRQYGANAFKISILEEYYGKDIESRLQYWIDSTEAIYNKDTLEHKTKPVKRTKSRLKWGIQRKKKPKAKRETNIIKCRSVETGKLKTLHGWEECAKFCNGNVSNIKKAVQRGGTAYGYKWWIYKKAGDSKRQVYGIHKDNGHVTPIFESITAAMKSIGEDDRGKGICTSIKWNLTWRGYYWYYADDQKTN